MIFCRGIIHPFQIPKMQKGWDKEPCEWLEGEGPSPPSDYEEENSSENSPQLQRENATVASGDLHAEGILEDAWDVEEHQRVMQDFELPDIGAYLSGFGIDYPSQVAMCRTYASYLVAMGRGNRDRPGPKNQAKALGKPKRRRQ